MQEVKALLQNDAAGRIDAFESVYRAGVDSKVKYWLSGVLALAAVILLLPWTQNIKAKGNVTTLRQEQRPQELNTIIAGRISKWYVREGDFVHKGDTIARLSEIKDNYMDPNILQRTREQIEAKSMSVSSYALKANAASAQRQAIEQARGLKLEQIQNKIRQLQLKLNGDSMDAVSAANDFRIADAQYKRQQIMRDSGLASLIQLEQRNQGYQSALAKKISADVKFTNAKTELLNTALERNQVLQEYNEKMAKTESDKAGAQGEMASGQGEIAKLNLQYANYAIRAGQYYLLAPQDGQVANASKSGINEIVKEGEKLLDIIPNQVQYAVEMFVYPNDVPLLSMGQLVTFRFDGFPAIVFSGWPKSSYGMFRGKIVAIENAINDKGKFRVLVGEDPQFKPWPPSLRMGTGANAIALLKDVPVWYEIWRNINGFPPDFYTVKDKKDEKKAKY